jgi:hypothetical protein
MFVVLAKRRDGGETLDQGATASNRIMISSL